MALSGGLNMSSKVIKHLEQLVGEKYTTGYFANTTRYTKVHIVLNGRPVCGSKVGHDMQYCWCARNVHASAIECEHCLKWYKSYIGKGVNDG